MRLMKRDLSAVEHYRKSEKPSGYIGTVREPELIGTICAAVNPVTDNASIQLYGERIGRMASITVLKGTDIRAGDMLKIGDVSYRVISSAQYSDHDVLTAERTEDGYTS